ncbi:DUF4262 domain-containing protein [Aeromonas hydrophila]|uniref:DUF4262 domain-containing protein n=1 Tax=Aeromonas hydrophila TaxID=644 RepID=UPI00080AA53A|nr:DUF4262 domain-containing protein [Aeromonas hydrophila]ANT70192.1 hypothetical protein TK34_22195 [Aeromonas hydrophila]
MTNYEKLQADIAAQIAKGHMLIMSVFGDPSSGQKGFAYTIGLTSLGLPEIMISGSMRSEVQHGLIEALAAEYKEHGISLGITHELLSGGLRAELVEVDCYQAKSAFIVQAANYYEGSGKTIRLVQIRWPDTQGRLPDEEGFDMGDKQDLLPRLTH